MFLIIDLLRTSDPALTILVKGQAPKSLVLVHWPRPEIPLSENTGRRCVLCLVADLTYLRQTEEAKQTAELLSRMSRKLIQAHEEERNWIAHELHEHIERLCLLSIDLERFGNIEAARQQIEGLAAGCQALSGRLHSTKLEYLGLDGAVASFCKELSDNERIEIDFVCNGIRTTLPEEISVSLPRVARSSAKCCEL
jgi:signal transduction histidine kinase